MISGLVSPSGPPGQVLKLWRNGRITPRLSTQLRDELLKVLAYPKIVRSTTWSQAELAEFRHDLNTWPAKDAEIFSPRQFLDFMNELDASAR